MLTACRRQNSCPCTASALLGDQLISFLCTQLTLLAETLSRLNGCMHCVSWDRLDTTRHRFALSRAMESQQKMLQTNVLQRRPQTFVELTSRHFCRHINCRGRRLKRGIISRLAPQHPHIICFNLRASSSSTLVFNKLHLRAMN